MFRPRFCRVYKFGSRLLLPSIIQEKPKRERPLLVRYLQAPQQPGCLDVAYTVLVDQRWLILVGLRYLCIPLVWWGL